jgi:hypothetical protein
LVNPSSEQGIQGKSKAVNDGLLLLRTPGSFFCPGLLSQEQLYAVSDLKETFYQLFRLHCF